MARATNKAELIAAANDQWTKMWKMIDAMPGGAQSVVFDFGDDPKYKEAHFLPEPYTWKTYGDMNVEFWKKRQSTPYETAASMLKDSHAKVMALIESFSDEELFDKKRFAWTGTTNIGAYCVSAAPSHYDWAMKKIKRFNKGTK